MQINYEKRIKPFCNHDVNKFAATVKNSMVLILVSNCTCMYNILILY